MKLLPIIVLVVALSLGRNVFAAGATTRALDRRQALPLNYANVVTHLKKSGLRPAQVQKRCTVFFEGEFKNREVYNYCLIIVENSDEDIQVTFYLTDAHEMNWVTEFLDAPFFRKDETVKLFGLMNSSKEARGERVGRYRVDSVG